MKKNVLSYYAFVFISAIFLLSSCNDENVAVSRPTIKISEESKKIDGANEGDLISIPFSVLTEQGVRKIAYYFIVNTPNGSRNEEPVTVVNFTENFPISYDGSIDFTIRTEMSTLILVAFNKHNQASEVHIQLSDLKKLPVFTFERDLDSKEKAFLGKNLRIRGNTTSEYDIKTFTYQIVKNGVAGPPIPIPFSNKREINFEVSFIVEEGLENVIFNVTNIHSGQVEKIYKVLNVLTEDDISIEISGGVTEIAEYIEDETNIIEGTVESGSDITGLSYSVKKDGMFGAPIAVELPSDITDLYNFKISIIGEAGTEAIKIIATNETEMIEEYILIVPKVDSYVRFMEDVVLTTEIGEGKFNWFSCWKEPHLFDQQTAAQYSDRMDFGAVTYTNGAPYLLSSMVWTAGGNYAAAITPYMIGFDFMTYLLMTANRADARNAFNSITKTSDLEALFNSTTYYAGAGRYTSGGLTAGNHHVIGWGNGVSQNKAIGIIRLKEINTKDGISTVKFDIKFGKPDYRQKYNNASLMPYNPSP